MDDLYRAFGEQLRGVRNSVGLSQGALASRVGVSRTSITNIERGTQRLPLHLLYRLAEALSVEPRDLLPDAGGLNEGAALSAAVAAAHLPPAKRAQLREQIQELPGADQRLVVTLLREGVMDGEDRPGEERAGSVDADGDQ